MDFVLSILLVWIKAGWKLLAGVLIDRGIEDDEFGFEADFALCDSVGERHNGTEVDIGIAFDFDDFESGIGFGAGFNDDFFRAFIFFVGDGDEVSALDRSDAGEVVVFELVDGGSRAVINGRFGKRAGCPEFAVRLQRFFDRNVCESCAAEDQRRKSDESGCFHESEFSTLNH